MITPSFGLTATERVLPKLALDFTTASLDPRITFTRSGDTATVVNSNGYIESALANTPRLLEWLLRRFGFRGITLPPLGITQPFHAPG